MRHNTDRDPNRNASTTRSWMAADQDLGGRIVGDVPTPGTGQLDVFLPHTGLWVPHDRLRVTDLQQVPTHNGVAFTATVAFDGITVGTVTNDGNGGPTEPYLAHPLFGWRQLATYVAACHRNGEPVTEEQVLDALVEEYDVAEHIRHALDPGALDPTDPAFPTLVVAWVEAAARHAATTLRRQRAQAVADVANVAATAGALAADGTAPLDTSARRRLPTGRSTILLAALCGVGFTTDSTPGALAGTYELRNAGTAILADLADDGTVALHATDPDGTHRWDLTCDPTTPLPLLTAVIGACSRNTGNHQREEATTFHPHTTTPAESVAFTKATGGAENGRDDV